MTPAAASTQAHALRAAAAFTEQAGPAGLPVTAGADGTLILRVPGRAGTPAARTAAAASPAAATGAPAPHRTVFGAMAWIAAAGTIAGHPVRVTTHIDDKEELS